MTIKKATSKKKVATKKKVVKKKSTAKKAPYKKELSEQHKKFAKEYLKDSCFNATQAAIAAGYSENGAGVQGHRLLKNANVAAYIAQMAEQRARRLEISGERVLRELAKLSFSDMSDYVDWGPDGVTLKPGVELDDIQTAAIAEITETTTQHGGSQKIKLHDKKGSLELLGRHLELFKEQVEHGITNDLKALLDRLDGADTGLPDSSKVK